MVESSWTFVIAGIIFCIGGVYAFFRNIYEEGKTLVAPAVVLLAGILLIAIGTAKYFHLIK